MQNLFGWNTPLRASRGLLRVALAGLLVSGPALAQEGGEKGPEPGPALPPGLPMPPRPPGQDGPVVDPRPPKSEEGSATISSPDGGTGSVTVKKVPCVPPNTPVRMDYLDTPLMDVTKYMAQITCRNFILGDKLDGTVTIISHKDVTVSEAYESYLSALEVAGYTTVQVGRNTKVVKTSAASKAPLKMYEDANIPETDNFVTQIVHLENVNATDVLSLVESLGGPSVKVIAYPPTNTLIITDSAYNIRRVYKIVKQFDVAAPTTKLEVIPIKHAAAADVAKILQDIFEVSATSSSSSTAAAAAANPASNRRRRRDPEADAAAAAPTAPSSSTVGSDSRFISKILSDERTNSLIVQATDASMVSIKELITKLDVDVDPYSKATIHVIQLNYANAEDVANVLSNLTDSRSSGGSSGSTSSRAGTSTTRPGANTNTRSTGASRAGAGSLPSGSSSFGRKPGESGGAGPEGLPPAGPPAGAPGVPGGAPAGGGSGNIVAAFENGLRITADENTNRLLVIAAPDDFEVIERVVRELDMRRQQVYVEAVVVEVGSSDDVSTGIGYHFGAPDENGGLGYASSQLGASSVGLSLTSLATGFAMGLMGQSVEVPLIGTDGSVTTTSVPAFGIALNALASDSKINILSNPNILCVDNEEATITVGRNVPFPVSAGLDSNNRPIVSYQREDVGITLQVTPQINEANYVTLDLNLEVAEVEQSTSSSTSSYGTDGGFITSKRQTENVVVVRDNQTIVIGGLIGTTDTTTTTKVPVLGDLPLVGVLFRSKVVTERKTNLLIFLTPHVINEPADLEEVYRVKMAQREEFLRRFYGKSREEQEAEFQALMSGSLNLVDQPSQYREKAAPTDSGTSREISLTPGASQAVPQPTGDVTPAPTPEPVPGEEP